MGMIQEGDIAYFRRKAMDMQNKLFLTGLFTLQEISGLYHVIYDRLMKKENPEFVYTSLYSTKIKENQ